MYGIIQYKIKGDIIMSFLDGKKTYIGLIVAALPTVAGLFGFDVADGGASELGALLTEFVVDAEALFTTGGLLFAAWGRKVTKG